MTKRAILTANDPIPAGAFEHLQKFLTEVYGSTDNISITSAPDDWPDPDTRFVYWIEE